ncbi:hypothetical protein [Methanolobus sp.]|nr:hypothetical protein [Methanolobus sp.]
MQLIRIGTFFSTKVPDDVPATLINRLVPTSAINNRGPLRI